MCFFFFRKGLLGLGGLLDGFGSEVLPKVEPSTLASHVANPAKEVPSQCSGTVDACIINFDELRL